MGTKLTREDLKRDLRNTPRAEVETLLEESGFIEHPGRVFNWQHTRYPDLQININPRERIAHPQVIRDANKAFQAIEEREIPASQQAKPAEKEMPIWVTALAKQHPGFKAELTEGKLIFRAADYPEYAIVTHLSGHDNTDQNIVQNSLEMNDANRGEGSLQHYIALLDKAKQLGLSYKVVDGKRAVFASTLEGIDKTSPLAFSGAHSDLIDAMVARLQEEMIHQQLFIEELRDKHGINVDHNPADRDTQNGTLTLTHPNLNTPIIITTHGTDEWIDKEGWAELQTAIKESKQEKAVRLPESAVSAPKPGQTNIVLDSSTLIDLCTKIKGSQHDLVDMLKETLKLPNIGKIIIPDYIADFEMRDTVRTYDSNDNSQEIPHINGKQFEKNRAIFRRFLKTAVRRHTDKDGKVAYLLEPGVREENVNKNIIIWETEAGQDMEKEIHRYAQAGDYDSIQKYYRRAKFKTETEEEKNRPVSQADLDKGELVIEELLRSEMPWANPVLILSNDRKYLYCHNTEPKTVSGGAKFYANTRTYLESELSVRGDDLAKKLSLSSTDIRDVYADIHAECGKGTDTLPMLRYQNCELTPNAYGNKILSLIKRGYEESKKLPAIGPQPAPVQVQVAAPVVVAEAPPVPVEVAAPVVEPEAPVVIPAAVAAIAAQKLATVEEKPEEMAPVVEEKPATVIAAPAQTPSEPEKLLPPAAIEKSNTVIAPPARATAPSLVMKIKPFAPAVEPTPEPMAEPIPAFTPVAAAAPAPIETIQPEKENSPMTLPSEDTFGYKIGYHRMQRDMLEKDLAAAVQEICKNQPNIDTKTVAMWQRNRAVPSQEIYEALVEVLIDKNPLLLDKDHAKAQFKIAYEKVKKSVASGANNEDDFADLLIEYRNNVGMTEGDLADELAKKIKLDVQEAPEDINKQLIFDIGMGEHVPSFGLLRAIVKALSDKSELTPEEKKEIFDSYALEKSRGGNNYTKLIELKHKMSQLFVENDEVLSGTKIAARTGLRQGTVSLLLGKESWPPTMMGVDGMHEYGKKLMILLKEITQSESTVKEFNRLFGQFIEEALKIKQAAAGRE